MSKRKRPWNPTTIKRFVKALPTSACTVIVETDAGKGYLKTLGNNEGPHILACEWIGTNLAKWFQLPTLDFAMFSVTDIDEIPLHNGKSAEVGPAFVTRSESGETWSGDKKQLDKLINPQDISRLVVFDTWTLNCDRYSVPADDNVGNARVNRGNVFLSEEAPAGHFMLKAMDHTHCFTCGRELSKKLRNIDKIRDPRVFGLFPEFRGFLDSNQVRLALSDLRTLSRAEVVRITQDVPKEWEVRTEAMNALVDLIVDRAAFVANTLEGQLWPQKSLPFDKSSQTEQPK